MNQIELESFVQTNTLDQAAAALEEERAEALARGDTKNAALASNDLGVVYMMLHRADDARDALGEALRLSMELDDAAGQGRAVGNLAQVEERAGNADQAAALYMQAADLLHAGSAFAEEFATRQKLSRYYMTRGATLMSLTERARALTVKPDAGAWDKIQRWFYSIPLNWMGVHS